MNILLIHQYYLEKDDGGGSRFNEMTRQWGEQGHQVTVLAGMVHYATGAKRDKYKGKYTLVEREFEENVDVIRCHVSESYNKSFLGRLWGYFSFVFSSVYAGLFKAKGKYDVILVTSPPLFVGITALVLSFFKRTPFVFEVRDLWPESAIDTGVLTNKTIISLAYWFERLIYRKSTLINVLTPAFKRKLIEEKNVPKGKVIFIPNAADFTLSDQVLQSFDRQSFRKEHGFEDKLVIIYVGAHGVANHLIQVVDTAELLIDKEQVLFLLIGGGMQKPMLIKQVEERGLKNVKFVDSVPKSKVFKYILASDLGASILKKVDTFKTIYSNKTFDYMACKKPVLMVIDGVSRQLVEAAGCGTFVEPENPTDFAAKVKSYLDADGRLFTEQGESGYQYAKKHFDRMVLANRYLEHLQEVAGHQEK